MTTLDPNQTWKLIHPDGHVIGQGSMSAICEHILDTQTRNDSLSLIEQAARAIGVIEAQVQSKKAFDEQRVQFVCDSITRLSIRLDSYIQRKRTQRRLDARRRQIAADEEQTARIKQALDALGEEPEADDPPEETHGELTTHPATEPAREEQLAAAGGASERPDQGDLPAELETGTAAMDPEELRPRAPTVQTPASFDDDDED
jgi:hypothetical protein